MLNDCPPALGGATAARMSWPGAITSGFSTSPPPAVSGPLEENAAVTGEGALYTIVAWLIFAVAPAVAAYAFSASRTSLLTWTVGTACASALIEFGVGLTRIIP